MKIKIAVLQLCGYKFDQEANKQKADIYCRKAKAMNADIILFPEMWNISYESFDDLVWKKDFDSLNISDLLKEKIQKWYSQAISIDSEFIRHFQSLAKELDAAIAITFLQKGNEKPFNSVALINRHGKIVLNYSKVHTCDFSMESFCEPGQEFTVCDLDTKEGIVKTGAMICFDREFPESTRELMLLGAEIILIPNSCNMDSHRSTQLRARAFENMTGVVLANYPSSKCNGNSQAYSPVAYDENGNEMNNLLLMAGEEEGIYMAEFDMTYIRKYRQREVWGNSYRKVGTYKSLLSEKILPPFLRKDARR